MISANELRQKYLDFFKEKGHSVISSTSLIPENDPTALFISAGMHPLVPYLLGEKHAGGKRLVNCQKCVRTGDIEEVGDLFHHTFFEMLGNWSLGDYFKEDAIKWSYEFLTDVKWLGLDVNKLAVTVFKGDDDALFDKESKKIWLSLGIPEKRIKALPKEDNWWGPAGKTGPCGPDTEIFYWVGEEEAPVEYDPSDKRWVEIWNNVFMQYNRQMKKAILVDGVNCLISKDDKLNIELAELLAQYGIQIIVATNAKLDRIKGALDRFNFDIFTLEFKIEKSDSKYFQKLLDEFDLQAGEVIYIDHKQDSVNSAKKIGIKAGIYTNSKKAKTFLDNNLHCYTELKQKNVDTGMGLERTLACLNNLDDDYRTELFWPIIEVIEELTDKRYGSDEECDVMFRVLSDHIRSAVFILGDDLGVAPSNLDQGYILRRLIRRAVRYARRLDIDMKKDATVIIAKKVIEMMKGTYPELERNENKIINELQLEEDRFERTLERGLKQFKKSCKDKLISGEEAFDLFSTYGFPLEITQELASEQGVEVDVDAFNKEFEKHQEMSRQGAEEKFKGGLADASVETSKLHTATHLLHSALRSVLGDHVEQRGSNITADRLRFDFVHPKKVTSEEIEKIEAWINDKIDKKLVISCEEMTVDQAKERGAIGIFTQKYGEMVKVYTINDPDTGEKVSMEICGGPHIENTSELGHFKVKKEQASSAGIRRIKAVLE